MTDLTSIPSHSPLVVARKTGNEYVIVPVTGNIADMDSVYTLNETGAFIWDQVDGTRSLREITQALKEAFEVDEITAESDVQKFIEEITGFLILK